MASLFWRAATVLLITGLFYAGTGLHRSAGRSLTADSFPQIGRSAYAAGLAVATNETETLLTTSPDGRTIYVWRYVGANPPMFLSKSVIGDKDE